MFVSVVCGLPACSDAPAPSGTPEVQTPWGLTDELDELVPQGQEGAGQRSEFMAFCDLIRSDSNAETPAAAEVLTMYRTALSEAPTEIRNELAALLDYLEYGIEPDYGEQLPADEFIPPEESSDDPATEPTDPYLFVSADAEQLALSVAAFLDLQCRGVALNPLPPPTVPAAAVAD